ncbi:MAG: polyprenyl synthetase family protein [Oscillospiraceae bacterium]|nr:polyprenyl synthetase family protein [Oscillospiraceae bacterium]
MMDVEATLNAYGAQVESALRRYLQSAHEADYAAVFDSMRYSVFGGGKRLRPALVYAFCALCGGEPERATPFAAAIEMVHTYSLIHDDLPCMDNDDLRRGRATNHKVYGDATALLAGDGLLNRAYETILNPAYTGHLGAEAVCRAAFCLADNAGADGMIGGQIIDMDSEGKAISLERLMRLQQLKTGCLIRAAAELGCIAAGKTDDATLTAARDYASGIGLAFQIRDDMLDIEGDAAVLGKSVGTDAAAGKSTFPSLLGMERCRQTIRQLTDGAKAALSPFQGAAFLEALADYLVSRDH